MRIMRVVGVIFWLFGVLAAMGVGSAIRSARPPGMIATALIFTLVFIALGQLSIEYVKRDYKGGSVSIIGALFTAIGSIMLGDMVVEFGFSEMTYTPDET
ncbi:MAG: hypothetical protein V7720_18650, partial [Halioglobus sp.]